MISQLFLCAMATDCSCVLKNMIVTARRQPAIISRLMSDSDGLFVCLGSARLQLWSIVVFIGALLSLPFN